MTLLASDNFRRTDTGDLGASWSPPWGNAFSIVSDTAKATIPENNSGERYTAVTWPDDQYSEVVLGAVAATGVGFGAGPACRMAAASMTLYWLTANADGWEVARHVSGVYTALDNDTSPTFAAGDVVRLEVRTNGANCDWVAKKNGVQFASGTDTSPITSGSAGIAHSSTDTTATINQWSGGNLDFTSPGPDNTNWHDDAITASTTVTVPLAATSGSVITVEIALSDPSAGAGGVTSVTYDGNALTELFDDELGTTVQAGVASYIGVAGANGAVKNVVVTLGTSLADGYCGVRATSWQGIVNSSAAAAHRTIYSGGAAGGGVNLTVTDSVAGDPVLSFIHSGITGSIAAVETVVGELHLDRLGGNLDWALQYKIATGASTVMAWTGDDFCTHVAYALVPAGGRRRQMSKWYRTLGST